MNKKKESHVCAICGKTFPKPDLVPGIAVRDKIAKEILNDHPEWSPESFICRNDLTKYRVKYVHFLLESEKGEITTLEQELLHSIRDHELLAKNVDTEFEQKWSVGERLADRIASFGGSWAFLMCFSAFITI